MAFKSLLNGFNISTVAASFKFSEKVTYSGFVKEFAMVSLKPIEVS